MSEIFVDIKDYEGYYKISNLGNVYSCRSNKILKATEGNGYLRVSLRVNGIEKKVLVHRLVALHFIDNPENKEQVNHIDGNKRNNVITNLEWVTQGENNKHAYGCLNRTKNGERKVWVESNGEVFEFESLTQLSKEYSVNLQTLYSFLERRNKTSKTMKSKGIDKASFDESNLIDTMGGK